MKTIRVGLAGNPNTGKTTIFNALTGSNQRVGNYAGVTVEKKEGRVVRGDTEIVVWDLPGIYSLTSYSIDEMITRDFILDERPDVIINVLDATNLERNLYLCLQFVELGLPVIGALNVIDQAESMGIRIDEKRLGELLGFPIVRTVGPRGKGLDHLLDRVEAVHDLWRSAAAAPASGRSAPRRSPGLDEPGRPTGAPIHLPVYSHQVESAIRAIGDLLESDSGFAAVNPCHWLAAKLLEKDANARQRLAAHPARQVAEAEIDRHIRAIERESGRDAEIVLSEQRYAWIHGAVREAVSKVEAPQPLTEKIDAVLLNRFLGLPIFLGILWLIFQATFTIGAIPQGWLEQLFSWMGDGVRQLVPPGLLQSLLADGIIAGVGGVLSFLPLVVILFMFISILEDTGYMARAAFIMDKFLHLFGLHGQSFLPMMVGFGCSVPAVMAARSLKSPRDRIVTILVIPFMSCGAKLPVYVLLAGTFFSAWAGTMVLAMYVIGIFLAMVSALIFRKTVLRGLSTPFVMELPPYRTPTARGILRQVGDKSAQYFKKAGTVILAAAILIWAITTFPAPPENAPGDPITYSVAGQIGKAIEPAFKPLGFDWKIAIATVTGFAAKEVVVSTLGVLYSVDDKNAITEGDDAEAPLRVALRADPAYNPLVGFTLMLFTLVLAPCFAAQATIRAELGWKWLGFYVAYSILAAWGLCFAVYQIGRLLGLGA
jgi:ferrous iron transport protein B